MKKLSVVLVVTFLCLVFSPLLKAAQFFFMENELIGKSVPDYSLKTTNGEKINLGAFRNNQKTIIFFWATWCPHCRESLKDMNKRQNEFAAKKIKLAMVDLGENEKTVKRYIEKNKIDFNIFLDERETLAEPYGIIGVPTFVFVNEKGIVKDVTHALPRNYDKVFTD